MRRRIRLLFIAALVLAGPASAEWKAYASNTNTTAYYDAGRVRSEPPYITVWVRLELDAPDKLADGREYRLQMQQLALDCKGEAWGVRFSAYYASREPSGAPILTANLTEAEMRIRPASPGSFAEILLKTACSKQATKG